MSINDWKTAVCDTREAYEHHCDISFSQESDASTDFIAALEGLCAAYEADRAEMKASQKEQRNDLIRDKA